MNVNQLEDLAATIERIQTAMVDGGVTPVVGYQLAVRVSDGRGGEVRVNIITRLEDQADESSWYLDAVEVGR